MSYTVDAKSDELTQFEDTEVYEPLPTHSYGGNPRFAYFTYYDAVAIAGGTVLGMARIPKGVKIIGISATYFRATAASVCTFDSVRVDDTGEGTHFTGDALGTGSTTTSAWIANTSGEVTDSEVIIRASITVSNSGGATTIRGWVCYVK